MARGLWCTCEDVHLHTRHWSQVLLVRTVLLPPVLDALMGHTRTLSQPAAWYAPLAEPALEDSSCSFRSVSCRTSLMGSTRSCSCSRIWRTSTPMSESRPRSASELSRLITARSRMPAKGDYLDQRVIFRRGCGDNLDIGTRYGLRVLSPGQVHLSLQTTITTGTAPHITQESTQTM